MAQPPFLIDQIQIEPGSGQTLLIKRDAATGSLLFLDHVLTGGIRLSQLAGLGAVSNVLVVGKAGAGAHYTTIQAALDAIPANASATSPYVVLIMPGRYDENLVIARDGVSLVGIGMPLIRSTLEATPDAPGNDHTVTIANTLGTPPLSCLIQGVRITNAHTNKAALRILGEASSTLLQTGLHLKDVLLEANAAGGNYAVWATAAGILRVTDSRFTANNSLSQVALQEMTLCLFQSCQIEVSLRGRYDTDNPQPAVAGGTFAFYGCPDIAALSALTPAISLDCDGAGSSFWHLCSMDSTLRFQISGDREHEIFSSSLGVLSVLETSQVSTRGTTVQSVLSPNSAAILDVDRQRGTLTFAGSTSEDVILDIPLSDSDYFVGIEVPSRPAGDETPWVTSKAATGFTVTFQTAQTMTVNWFLARR